LIKKLFAILAAAVMLLGMFAAVPRAALAYDELKNTDPDKYYILLDLKNQMVTVFERDANGEYTKVVRRFICSSGKSGTGEIDPVTGEKDEGLPTPKGIWKIGARERFGEFAAFRGTWARYWTQIVGGNFFHSIMYDRQDVGTLQSGAFRSLGNNVSHGCVRLYVEDAKWLYYYACPGTTIKVSTTEPSNNGMKKLLKTTMSFTDYKAFQANIFDIDELPNPKAWVVKEGADLRTGNGSNDRTIKRLSAGTEVEILQIAEPWLKVKYEKREGYIRTAFMTFQQGTVMSREDADIIKETAYMFTLPEKDAEQITKVPTYSTVEVIEPDKDGWTKIAYWGHEGYIQSRYVIKGWGVVHSVMDEIMPTDTYKAVYNLK
jgi:uncharacterized protein YgiM (DUF1202 family)